MYSQNEDLDDKNNKNNLTRNYNNKYKIFRDEEAPVIFDINEEKERIKLADLELVEKETDPYDGINLNRGIHGVFDIEDLVDLLRKDKNNRQIFVALVPHEYNYVDYMVLVTGKSAKHMNALAMYVRKIYKAKKHKNDFIPKIEGKNNSDWIALDLGNIALHIFNYETRLKYDLETLWSVGSNYDTLSRERIDDDFRKI
ncbi:PREDICTED: mitochondrial assembly of ribosomal large subunit protein 1 [Ceratosolen solmsi marchali]|uniref:Mitochondrial assembly of ribosomal large subunit protein 1 n=1 Tax=Ceratosolen solmsi marchali TaxID=326594 RepID=A0AAJ6YWV2_9HYME|nr:PREDICTED: mitochondrial assembly of ribosomal large subunit protein 1 [Ceratosolen solmsi marchali]